MLPPVTVRIGQVWSVPTDGSAVEVVLEGDTASAVIVGPLPEPGSSVLLLSTYDRLYCLGSLGGVLPDAPTLPPLDPRPSNALNVTADGALTMPQWIRHGSTVVILDADLCAPISHERMPEPFDPVNATVIVGLGDAHRTITGPVLPWTSGRTRDEFTVEVVGGRAGQRLRVNWLIAADLRDEDD